MNATETPLEERIRSFAAAVRAHLDDLPGDEQEEIISGLIADLTDQAVDNDGALELGDPGEYAAELRAAAGLPERAQGKVRVPLEERMRAGGRRLAARIRQNPTGAAVLSFLIALHPVWWVLRGWGIYAVLRLIFGIIVGSGPYYVPRSFIDWVIVLLCVIVSVQWGRGRWFPKNFLRHGITVVGILTLVLLPFGVKELLEQRVNYVYEDSNYTPQQGLLLDGVQVGNIFAYDEDGNPIDRVQLFTDKGTSLNLYGKDSEDLAYSWYSDDGRVYLPWLDSFDRDTWNVYPLRTGTADYDSSGELQTSDVKDATAPFAHAPNTIAPSPEPTSTEPSPVPTDGGSETGEAPAPDTSDPDETTTP